MAEYIVLEGVKYRKIKRMANEGDLILVSWFDDKEVSCVRRVKFVYPFITGGFGYELDSSIGNSDYLSEFAGDKYVVLERTNERNQCDCDLGETLKIVSNLATRLTKLERQLNEHEQELNELNERLAEDIIEIDSRTQPLVKDGVTKFAEDLVELIVSKTEQARKDGRI